MNKIRFSLLVVIATIIGISLASCEKEQLDAQTPVLGVNELKTTQNDGLLQTRSRAQIDYDKWHNVKAGSNVNLYRYDNKKIYIAEIDLRYAKIGLTWGYNYIPNPPESWQSNGCHYFKLKNVKKQVSGMSNIFLATNFNFFGPNGDGTAVSSYPFKQGNFTDIGGSKPYSSDYNHDFFAMIVKNGRGIKLEPFSSSDYSSFSNTYSSYDKVYIVRDNEGNSNGQNTEKGRTILAVSENSLVNGYYKKLYLLVVDNYNKMTENNAKKYIRNFIYGQLNMCTPITYMPLDGGGSSQLYVKNATQYNCVGDYRGVVNALIVKDN